MAKTVERVRLDKVLPLVDEYGNEFLNRDYGLEVNQRYVSELAASFKDGEPDELIVVVRDGDAFRIRAGNSRVRAMKELGTEECWAVVDDISPTEALEQAVNETVVRTNVKKKYEPEEEARFTRQLFLFGDDEYVGGVSGIGAENAGKVRRAAEMAGDRASQMSLDQMYAAAEFEGHPEIAEKIIASENGDWRFNIDYYRREARDIEGKAAFRNAAAELKVELVDDRPEDKVWVKTCRDPQELSADYMEVSVGHKAIVGRLGASWSGAFVDLYGEPIDKVAAKEAAAEAERRRKADSYDAVFKSIDESTLEWFNASLKKMADAGRKQETILSKFPALKERAYDAFFDIYWVKGPLNLVKEARGWGIGITDFAIGYDAAREHSGYRGFGALLAAGEAPKGDRAKDLERYLEWADLHVSDGWEPDGDQAKAIAAARRLLGKGAKA